MIQFLIDECLTPKLVEVANEFGYAAHHVQYRQWKSKEDSALLAFIRAEDLTIVTNNWKDFEPMLRREEVHPVPSFCRTSRARRRSPRSNWPSARSRPSIHRSTWSTP